MKKKTIKRVNKKQRINNAIDNLKRINEIIAPYIPNTRIEEMPKGGEWRGEINR